MQDQSELFVILLEVSAARLLFFRCEECTWLNDKNDKHTLTLGARNLNYVWNVYDQNHKKYWRALVATRVLPVHSCALIAWIQLKQLRRIFEYAYLFPLQHGLPSLLTAVHRQFNFFLNFHSNSYHRPTGVQEHRNRNRKKNLILRALQTRTYSHYKSSQIELKTNENESRRATVNS